jgi:hypothetical protein
MQEDLRWSLDDGKSDTAAVRGIFGFWGISGNLQNFW